jgi:hypothetical protein
MNSLARLTKSYATISAKQPLRFRVSILSKNYTMVNFKEINKTTSRCMSYATLPTVSQLLLIFTAGAGRKYYVAGSNFAQNSASRWPECSLVTTVAIEGISQAIGISVTILDTSTNASDSMTSGTEWRCLRSRPSGTSGCWNCWTTHRLSLQDWESSHLEIDEIALCGRRRQSLSSVPRLQGNKGNPYLQRQRRRRRTFDCVCHFQES